MNAEMQKVSVHYIDGIKSGRDALRKYGIDIAKEEIENLKLTIKGFDATSPVGQLLRGERDFWLNQINRVGGHA